MSHVMTYGGSKLIKTIQKNNKMTCVFVLVLGGGGGGQDKPAWTACPPPPPGVKITRVRGKIFRDSLPPGGQAVQGAR